MPDRHRLNELTRAALERANDRGHRLGGFRAARSDPDYWVAFCRDCRHVVIVDASTGPGHAAGRAGVGCEPGLYGYALLEACSGPRGPLG